MPNKVILAFNRKLEEYKLLPEEELLIKFESDKKLSKTYKLALLAALQHAKSTKETKADSEQSSGNSTDS